MRQQKKIVKVKTLLPKKPVKPHENSFSKNKSAVPAEISSLHIRKKKIYYKPQKILARNKITYINEKSQEKKIAKMISSKICSYGFSTKSLTVSFKFMLHSMYLISIVQMACRGFIFVQK